MLTNKDADTAAAVAGAVAGAYYGVPEEIAKKTSSLLPKEFKDVIHDFQTVLEKR